MPTRRLSNRPRAEADPASSLTSFLAWSILILLLVGAAALSWVGSIYVFGHPEEPFSYSVLKTFGKLEPPKRFELTAAPRGEFLEPQALWERFGAMTPSQLREANRLLLRNYIRNYQQMKDPVPYVTGKYVILDSFELTPDDFFPSGVVALAKAQEDPRILLEHVFPAGVKQVEDLQRMLLTGVEFTLQRRMDMSAVVCVEKLRDGRLKLTAVPLIYGTYAAAQGPGTFSLEPPSSLNVAVGLPLLRSARLEAAAEKYASFRRRAGLPPDHPGASGRSLVGELLRVHRPDPVGDVGEETAAQVELPAHRAIASVSPPPHTPQRALPALPVEPAQPGTAAAGSSGVTAQGGGQAPLAGISQGEIAGGLPPADSGQNAAEIPVAPQPSPIPAATAASPTPPPADAIANVRGRNWQVYAPGQMPRGRLVPMGEIPLLAERGLAGERLYLQGTFVVTAASSERAVLRYQSAVRGSANTPGSNIRVIVDFPAGVTAPAKGETVSRDGQRPFLITGVRYAENGQINVDAREVTRGW